MEIKATIEKCRPADLSTRCRTRQSIEKRVPACLPDVVEGSDMRREVPTCLPCVEGGSQLRKEVPTCLPGVDEGSQLRREVLA